MGRTGLGGCVRPPVRDCLCACVCVCVSGAVTFRFTPAIFRQANLDAFERIIDQVVAFVPKGSRVCELYSGIGVIGLNVLMRTEAEWYVRPPLPPYPPRRTGGAEGCQVGGVSRSPDGLFAQQEREPIRGRPAVRGKRTYGGRPGQRVEEQGTWAARKHSEAGYGRPVDRGVWTARTVKQPRQQPAHP